MTMTISNSAEGKRKIHHLKATFNPSIRKRVSCGLLKNIRFMDNDDELRMKTMRMTSKQAAGKTSVNQAGNSPADEFIRQIVRSPSEKLVFCQ